MFDHQENPEDRTPGVYRGKPKFKRAAQRSTRPASRAGWQTSGVVAKAKNRILRNPERGDVPGWVLITLMTAGLVVALWAIAGPALEGLFNDAITKITQQAG